MDASLAKIPREEHVLSRVYRRYTISIVSKKAVSVTLDATNLVWLRARAGACGARSLSELLDRLVAEARTKGSAPPPTSVVGTIDVPSSDPLLLGADETIRAMFSPSLQRPLLVREPGARYHAPARRKRARRG